MKTKVTRADGACLEAEGGAEELAALVAKFLEPGISFAPAVQPTGVPAPCLRPHADEYHPWPLWPGVTWSEPNNLYTLYRSLDTQGPTYVDDSTKHLSFDSSSGAIACAND